MERALVSAQAMRRTWLIQRLLRPAPQLGAFPGNPFAFGGGLKNGGLSDDAIGLLRSIFAFDYMGSSEFEWGAVPEALRKIAAADLAAFKIEVPIADVPKSRRDKSDSQSTGFAAIFALCPREWDEEVERRINVWARMEHPHEENGQASFKELPLFTQAIHASVPRSPSNDGHADIAGWLELDNGFMFFTDWHMWDDTCALFGVEP